MSAEDGLQLAAVAPEPWNWYSEPVAAVRLSGGQLEPGEEDAADAGGRLPRLFGSYEYGCM